MMPRVPSLISAVKWLVASAACLGRRPKLKLAAAHSRAGGLQTAFLMYHRVVEKGETGQILSSPGIVVFRDSFERQMQYLSRNYDVMSLREYMEARESGSRRSLRTAVITFDDGWADNYSVARPVLARLGLSATVFVSTSFVGGQRVFWQERLRFLLSALKQRNQGMPREAVNAASRLPGNAAGMILSGAALRDVEDVIESLKGASHEARERFISELGVLLGNPDFPLESNAFITWGQAREMSAGGIAIASHGRTHRRLTELAIGEVEAELIESRRDLEGQGLGRDADLLAYPNGDCNATVAEKAEALGYSLAVTTEPGLNTRFTDRFRLKRINVCEAPFLSPWGGFSERLFEARLSGLF